MSAFLTFSQILSFPCLKPLMASHITQSKIQTSYSGLQGPVSCHLSNPLSLSALSCHSRALYQSSLAGLALARLTCNSASYLLFPFLESSRPDMHAHDSLLHGLTQMLPSQRSLPRPPYLKGSSAADPLSLLCFSSQST